ncbi:Uma2 family endonuclease [Deinococcus metallilatus]|uniref:Uma2 family endonuclease n=1 Tax=Deinococcus metallilatus TaxID=1211322 RepID=A0AAJ5F449_9DEIO|nr:Uma2 family endonuclease [Deinococcus metallilatus]MBB5295238.1 Uma2 family endonuclease [Deinococcus metallilatus]QBY08600.1 Uma2 family endonuclease [Deinococcus metallilatus]RXJ10479.1 Uma2 family endonuclease [Deinococcus metallilatus]TLK26450.1 Uma2 family endonuclease [Deinococcus metallilatus]
MSDPAFQRMSVEEYLRTEPDSPVKREYVNGFVYPLHGQAGTSDAHDSIVGNIFFRLFPLALAVGCRAYTSDMRVRSADGFSYFYPDTTVTCEPRQDDARFKVAPCILVEVLSKSTAHNDHNGKYHAYTALPSLQTYLIVEQTERRVYVYQREGPRWTMLEYAGSGQIPLPCLAAELSLDDIYDGVL